MIGHGGNGGAGGDAGNFGRNGIINRCLTTDTIFTYDEETSEGMQKLVVPGGKGGAPGHHGTLYGDAIGIADFDSASADGRPGRDGVSRSIQSVVTNNIINKDMAGDLVDPVQLMMVVQRLLFEYQMHYGTQTMVTTKSPDTIQGKDFVQSFAWVGTIAQSFAKADSVTTSDAMSKELRNQAVTALAQLTRTMQHHLDLYGNALNEVEDPSIALRDVLADITSMDDIEAIKTRLSSILADIEQKADAIRETAIKLKDDDDTFLTRVNQQAKDIGSQYQVIEQCTRDVSSRKDALVKGLEKFWNDAKGYFNGCEGWQNVLSAAGSVMMFAGPDANAEYAVGGTLSVGASLSSMRFGTDPNDPTISGDVIERKIYMIESDVKDLQFEITKKYSDSLVMNGPDPKLLTTIITERNNFVNLCDSYFDPRKIHGIEGTKSLFDDFINVAQNSKVQIQNYNKLVVAYLKLKEDHVINAKSFDLLRTTNAQLNAPELDLFYAFFTQAYARKKASTIRRLYQGVRAYNCASMKKSDAFDVMSQLGSFDNVNSDVLRTAFMSTLADEVRTLHSFVSTNPRVTFTGIMTMIDAKTHPFLFKQFVKQRSFLYYPFIQRRSEDLGMEMEWYDIRIIDFRIFLDGAVVKTHDDNKVVNVFVKFGSVFTVQDEDFIEHDFQIPERSMTYSYKYDGAKHFQTISKMEMSVFEFDLSDVHSADSTYKMALASPFTRWNISVSDRYDLSKLTSIQIQMDIRFRTNEDKRRAGDDTEDAAGDEAPAA
jgi:hypothetical protein